MVGRPMSEPETRVHHWVKDGLQSGTEVAIPWCTTHEQAAIPGNITMPACRHAVDVDQVEDCVISMGGPDHKWWVDV